MGQVLRVGRGVIIAVFGAVSPSVVVLDAIDVAFEEAVATDQTDELDEEVVDAIDAAGEYG